MHISSVGMARTNFGCTASAVPHSCLKTVVRHSSTCLGVRNALNLLSKPCSPATVLSRGMYRSPVPASPYRPAPSKRPSPVMSCSSAQAKPVSGQGIPWWAQPLSLLLVPAAAVAVLGRVIDGKGLLLASYWAVRYLAPAALGLWFAKRAGKRWNSLSAVVALAATYAASSYFWAGPTSTVRMHYPLFNGSVTIPAAVGGWIRCNKGLAKTLTMMLAWAPWVLVTLAAALLFAVYVDAESNRMTSKIEFGIKPSVRRGSHTSARSATSSTPAAAPIAAAALVASTTQASNLGKAESMSADTSSASEAEAQHGDDSQDGCGASEEQSSSQYDDSGSQNSDFHDAYVCLTQLRDVMRGVDTYIAGLEHGADVKQHAVYLRKRLDRIEPLRMTDNTSLNQVVICCSCFKAQVEETLKAVQPDRGLHASATIASSGVSLSEPKAHNATTLAILEDILQKHQAQGLPRRSTQEPLVDARDEQDEQPSAGQLSIAPDAIPAHLAEARSNDMYDFQAKPTEVGSSAKTRSWDSVRDADQKVPTDVVDTILDDLFEPGRSGSTDENEVQDELDSDDDGDEEEEDGDDYQAHMLKQLMHSQEGKLAYLTESYERQLADLKGSHERELVDLKEDLQGQVEEAEQQVEQLEEQLEYSQFQCDKLRHKQFLHDELGQKATGETDRLSRRIAELLALHEAELRAMADRHNLQTQQLEEAHQEGIAGLKRDHDKQQEEKEHEMQGLAERHQQSVEALEAYHQGQQYELNIRREEEAAELHRQLDDVNAQAREEAAGLSQQLRAVAARLDEAIAEQSRLKQAHARELQTCSSVFDQQLSDACNELHSAKDCVRENIDHLIEELQEEQAEKTRLWVKLQELQQHEDELVAQHSNQVHALHKEFAVKRAQAVAEPVKTAEELRQQLSDAQGREQKLQEELNSQQRSSATSVEALAIEHKCTRDNLQAQVDRLTAAMAQPHEATAEVAKLKLLYDTTLQKLDAAMTDLGQTQDELSQVRKEAEEGQSTLVATQNEKLEVNTRAEELAMRCKWMESNILNLEADLQAVGRQHEAAHTEADNKLKALTSENSLLKNRVNETLQSHMKTAEEHEALQEEHHSMCRQLEELLGKSGNGASVPDKVSAPDSVGTVAESAPAAAHAPKTAAPVTLSAVETNTVAAHKASGDGAFEVEVQVEAKGDDDPGSGAVEVTVHPRRDAVMTDRMEIHIDDDGHMDDPAVKGNIHASGDTKKLDHQDVKTSNAMSSDRVDYIEDDDKDHDDGMVPVSVHRSLLS